MGEQDTNFFMDNIVLIGILALAIFGYLLVIVRKRSRQKFLHKN
jgi:hypothetical protein